MVGSVQVVAGGVWVLGAILALGAAPDARAEEMESRDFLTKIDGTPVGQYRMTITRKEDGSVVVACSAAVRMTKLGITTYYYTYRGTEVWSAGRLISLRSLAGSSFHTRRFRSNTMVRPSAEMLGQRTRPSLKLVRARSAPATGLA